MLLEVPREVLLGKLLLGRHLLLVQDLGQEVAPRLLDLRLVPQLRHPSGGALENEEALDEALEEHELSLVPLEVVPVLGRDGLRFGEEIPQRVPLPVDDQQGAGLVLGFLLPFALRPESGPDLPLDLLQGLPALSHPLEEPHHEKAVSLLENRAQVPRIEGEDVGVEGRAATAPRHEVLPAQGPAAHRRGHNLQVLARLHSCPRPLGPRPGVFCVAGRINLDLLDLDAVWLQEAVPVGQVVAHHFLPRGFRHPQEVRVRGDGGGFPQPLQKGLDGHLLLPRVESVADVLSRLREGPILEPLPVGLEVLLDLPLLDPNVGFVQPPLHVVNADLLGGLPHGPGEHLAGIQLSLPRPPLGDGMHGEVPDHVVNSLRRPHRRPLFARRLSPSLQQRLLGDDAPFVCGHDVPIRVVSPPPRRPHGQAGDDGQRQHQAHERAPLPPEPARFDLRPGAPIRDILAAARIRRVLYHVG